MQDLGGTLQKILINDLADGTFFAKLFVLQGDIEHEIDCRPSDAIALGVAMDVPIYVEEFVLDEVEKDAGDQDSSETYNWE
jgi:bifunctional DNase/RNase